MEWYEEIFQNRLILANLIGGNDVLGLNHYQTNEIHWEVQILKGKAQSFDLALFDVFKEKEICICAMHRLLALFDVDFLNTV